MSLLLRLQGVLGHIDRELLGDFDSRRNREPILLLVILTWVLDCELDGHHGVSIFLSGAVHRCAVEGSEE